MHEFFWLDLHIPCEDGTDIRLTKAGYSLFTETIPEHVHGKDTYELHYIPDGKGKLLLEDDEYELEKGTLFITGPGLIHAQETDEDSPLCEYCLNIELNGKADNILTKWRKAGNFLICQAPEMESSFKALFGEAKDQMTGYREMIISYLQIILTDLSRLTASEKEQENTEVRSERCKIVIDECFLHGYASLTLERLAMRINLSARQTERLLKDYYGKTYRQKLREARISASKDMLRSEMASIAEIAEKAGYSSYGHFSSAFKAETGMTPLEYRERTKA